MAIDPRISLGVQTPNLNIQAPDPWQRVQRMMTLRDMMQRRELQAEQIRAQVEERELKAQQLREQMDAAQRLQGVFSRYAAQPPAGPPEAPVTEAMEAGALQGYAPELLAPLANRPPREGYAAGGTPRYPSYGEVFDAGGVEYGIPAWEAIQKAQKEERLAENARLEQEGKDAIERGNIAQGIISGGDSESYTQGILELLRRGKISEERAGRFLNSKWYSPETRSALKIMVAAGNKAYDQTEEARKQRKAELEEPGIIAEGAKKLSEAEKEGIQRAAGRLAAAASRGPEAFEAQLAQEAPEHQQFFAGSPSAYEVMKRAQDPDKYTATVQGEYGKITPVSPAVFAQQKQLRSTGPPRQPLAVGAADQALADTVIANPALYENLTPSAKTRIAPLLAEKGFTGFGKPMAESAIGQVAQSRSAIESLKDLRTTLKENEQYIGPIGGVQALNPYSEARQAQAKINLVRQRVGKALEGGVLRKEDEEKYKQILATLYDTPSTAIAKVDNLLATLERDIKIFEEEQRRGGRNVPARTTAAPSGGKKKSLDEIFK